LSLAAALFLAAALATAVINLYAVIASRLRVEAFTKPGVLVLLILAALVLHPHIEAQRWLFIVGLALGLAGDIFLLPQLDRLIPAIAAFGAGHLAYIAGFLLSGFRPVWVAAGVVVVVVAAVLMLPRIVRGLRDAGSDRLVGPVVGYAVLISAFVVSAAGSGRPVGALGALLFYASDGLLSWYRFVGPRRWGRTVNIALYHLGQTLLVVSLAV
jgi:uncharacterized membrane protein YhhN